MFKIFKNLALATLAYVLVMFCLLHACDCQITDASEKLNRKEAKGGGILTEKRD